MSTIVVDTSVIIKWLSHDNEKYIDVADKLLRDAEKGKIELIAPELAKYEVGNVLRFSKNLSSSQAVIVLAQFYNLPITFIGQSVQLAQDTYFQSESLRITYYDASFLSLAIQYEAMLVTENIKHQGKKIKGLNVIPLKNY